MAKLAGMLHPCIARYGECRYGDTCRFATVPADNCMEWLRRGTCKFGDKCRYKHPKAVDEDEEDGGLLPAPSLVAALAIFSMVALIRRRI